MLKSVYRLLKSIGALLLIVTILISTYLLSAYLFSRVSVNKKDSGTNDVSIYILTNGVHTDLVMPIKNNQIDWSDEIKFENTVSKDTLFQYVALGWGDKGFYLETPTWADLKFSTAFKAAFALGSTAIHATFYTTMIEGKDCVKIKLSKEQYIKLIHYIKSSFRLDANGHLINIKSHANYGINDTFYEATGSYSLFHTCNTWANNGLKSCEQLACLWTPFDTGIFYQYNQHK
ncbi:TIGR02117 family protein [Spirosoma foliorum]|uniref:TIGR02117 family protein n=1 Tax=Spirosoma foliorum TaxID=2710596 RepID=A0A7G5GQ20_9BACT|nr:TIGR02117 family protein [Spirosoma foliorum]QMW00962.1 TIGR02117 family protein [Spirosoma foliorum]